MFHQRTLERVHFIQHEVSLGWVLEHGRVDMR